ncbi:hypothetical protein FRO72_RS24775 [Escherichia coli]
MSMVEWISHEKKDSLILFVHGLNGGLETWNFNKETSFPKLLAEMKTLAMYLILHVSIISPNLHKRMLKRQDYGLVFSLRKIS